MRTLFVVLFALFVQTINAQPPTTPFLRIETGMHNAAGRRLSTDAEGKYLLTCSDDKTARFWDAATGTLLNTFRIPIGTTNEGKIYACALTPDAKIAALGGWTVVDPDSTVSIYLVSTQTGVLLHRIKLIAGESLDMEFSSDGKWLAVGLGEGSGVNIYDAKTWELFKNLDQHTGAVHCLNFNKQGGLATGCYDGKLRIFNKNFDLVLEKKLTSEEIYTVAFNPAGTLVAIGYENISQVEVRNVKDLSLAYRPSIKGAENIKGGLSTLSFSSDGNKLFGGGAHGTPDDQALWKYVIRSWTEAGKGNYTDNAIMGTTIMDMKALPGGSMAVLGFYPDLSLVSPENKLIWYIQAKANNFASNDTFHFRINPTGSAIGFTPYGQPAFSYDVLQRKLAEEETMYPSPVASKGSVKVTDWNANYIPLLNKKRLDFIQEGEMCNSTDIGNNGNVVVFGTSWNIYAADNNGQLLWTTQLPSVAWTLNISGNDKVVAAALGDGTIRWYRMTDGQELLAFYLHSDLKRWVLFTPTGYYDASPGADDFLGWHLNNGPDQSPSFYPVSRFKEKYYRPDVIDAILEFYDEELALKKANKDSKKPNQTEVTDIRQKLPPIVTINSPANGTSISTNLINISYTINSPDDAPSKNVRVLVDGRPVATERGLKPKLSADQKLTITVPSKDCIITILAENDNGTSPESNLLLKWIAPAIQKEEFVYKPKLYILAIGVSNYNNPDLKLGFASKDAGDFTNTLLKQKGILYGDVIITKLLDKDATKDAITDGLDWIQKQTGQKDVAMIFFAGHGLNDNNNVFYMLPVGADLQRIRTTCLNFEELKQTVSAIAGKVVVWIDACHSGNAMGASRRGGNDINALVNELSSTENGAITYTSSTGKEYSLEDPSWGNGAFTKAVIEGLNGKATFAGKNKITIKSLDAYISERVKELTKGQQHPTSVTPPNVPDFPIAVSQ